MSWMAWLRARERPVAVTLIWLLAWSRAMRTVAVKEIRSGSIPAVRAAWVLRAHNAW